MRQAVRVDLLEPDHISREGLVRGGALYADAPSFGRLVVQYGEVGEVVDRGAGAVGERAPGDDQRGVEAERGQEGVDGLGATGLSGAGIGLTLLPARYESRGHRPQAVELVRVG